MLRLQIQGKSQLHTWPTTGWQTSTPEQQGTDSEKLAEALDFLQEEDVNIHSLLIIRNGYIVADVANVDAKKEAMTLEDLLTMRSGFECVRAR